MRNQKMIMGLLISSILAAMLAGCNGNAPSLNKAETKPPGSTASLETERAALDKNEAAVLYIGEPDHLREVSVQDAATAEELIAAIAKETGWNLTLAQTPAAGELQDTLKIALAADSAIYNAPPEQQKDSYHVFDSEDYVLTVLNSVSETLCRNLDLDGVYFTSPDGGVLTLTNGGYSFCYSNIYCWDYAFARDCNEPLPQDELGPVFLGPNGVPIVEGPNTMEIVFKRSNVQQMPGTLTIYNEDGSVYETIATDDTTKMRSEPVPDYQRNYYNLKAEEEGYNSALENEIYRQLKLLLEELPEQCKNIFQRTLSGDTSEKIAADLKLSVETVKTQRKKAKRILRERYTLLFKTFGILF